MTERDDIGGREYLGTVGHRTEGHRVYLGTMGTVVALLAGLVALVGGFVSVGERIGHNETKITQLVEQFKERRSLIDERMSTLQRSIELLRDDAGRDRIAANRMDERLGAIKSDMVAIKAEMEAQRKENRDAWDQIIKLLQEDKLPRRRNGYLHGLPPGGGAAMQFDASTKSESNP